MTAAATQNNSRKEETGSLPISKSNAESEPICQLPEAAGSTTKSEGSVTNINLPEDLPKKEVSASHELVNNIEMVMSSTEQAILETEKEPPKYPTSFLEVMELVQSGEKIPGIEEIHVEPTNKPPTTASAMKVKKPWQT